MITGGKSKYASLLTLIKAESSQLYELICDLCLDGTFRSQRYENTFLFPNAKLVKKLVTLVDNDKDVEAIGIIRSLLLKGHQEKSAFKSGEKIGTLQFGSYVLSKPEEVAAHISKSKKEIIATREGAYATIVYDYDGESAPSTMEGKASGGAPKVSKHAVGAEDEDVKKIKKITESLIVKGEARKTVKNFFSAVAAALNILESDKDKYKRAKFYLAANPIISWFFLTMPGRNDALVKASDLEGASLTSTPDAADIITSAFEYDYEPDMGLLKSIAAKRSDLMTSDRSDLIQRIISAYKDIMPSMVKSGAIDERLGNNLYLKILMDEVCYRHDDSVTEWADVNDCCSELGAIEWGLPKKSQVVCDEGTYKGLKCTEAFVSGPSTFVKSIYFISIPLSEEIKEKLLASMKRGGANGNPMAVSSVVFNGGAARAHMKSSSDMKLSSLVKVLSKSQREALKALL